MKNLQTEVLVIGGGATGTGILRDLAMQGIRSILIEKGGLTHGTTGRYHGLLHSGARYAVKDPPAAQECITENRILKRIMPECIEDTGGYFVITPFDDPDYGDKFLAGCKRAGIPVEEVPVGSMLRQEPYLNPRILRCFRVPDGSADSFLATDMNASSARQYGAQILSYNILEKFLIANNQIRGAVCRSLIDNEESTIEADFIINATGAWAGQIAKLAGLSVRVIPGKGSMLAINHRIVNTVINRCKPPSDGDILVPAHTVAVMGTTDVPVKDPDHFAIEPWEVHLMLEEGDKIIPGFSQMRILRAWAGVRPLYQEKGVSDTRDISRAFVLLDHETRDGLFGLITITCGKWTTYRKMAESAVDLVCLKLNIKRNCRTHLEPLPDPRTKRSFTSRPGSPYRSRLAEVEENRLQGSLICECELTTEDEITHSILENSAKSIDDIRRETRMGMGPCQGGFCTYRAAGLLHKLRPVSVDSTNLALRDFLDERWKGLLPILWGQQLRQERLDQLIYLSILNADHLGGSQSGPLSPDPYLAPRKNAAYQNTGGGESGLTMTRGNPDFPLPQQDPTQLPSSHLDVIVVGAGLSGLFSAYLLAQSGKRVRLITKGWGSLYFQTGCIDILGYEPFQPYQLIESPKKAIENSYSNKTGPPIQSIPHFRLGTCD